MRKKNMARSRSQRKSRIAKNSRSRGNDENWITYHKTEAIKWRKIKTAIKKIPFRLEQFIYIYFALFERMRAWSVCMCWCIFFYFVNVYLHHYFHMQRRYVVITIFVCYSFHIKKTSTRFILSVLRNGVVFFLAYLFMQFCNIWNVTKSQQQPADCLQSQWPKQKKHRHYCGILFYIMRQFITNNRDSHQNKNSKT